MLNVNEEILRWRPIQTSPRAQERQSILGPRVLLWCPIGVYFGRWDDDRFAHRPRPFWILESTTARNSRTLSPTFQLWAEVPKGP